MFTALEVRRGLQLDTVGGDIVSLPSGQTTDQEQHFVYYLLRKTLPDTWPPTAENIGKTLLDTLPFLKFNTKSSKQAKRAPEMAPDASRSRSEEAEAEFESSGLLGEILRERRIALLQSSADVDESCVLRFPQTRSINS
ncbi:unnamed protein product, partial [Symbiodinium microadriaticum]